LMSQFVNLNVRPLFSLIKVVLENRIIKFIKKNSYDLAPY